MAEGYTPKERPLRERTDLYEIVGVPRDATPAEIKAAFRKLVLKIHPDQGGHDDDFKALNNAYSTLSDPQQRAAYDRTRSRPSYSRPQQGPFTRAHNTYKAKEQENITLEGMQRLRAQHEAMRKQTDNFNIFRQHEVKDHARTIKECEQLFPYFVRVLDEANEYLHVRHDSSLVGEAAILRKMFEKDTDAFLDNLHTLYLLMPRSTDILELQERLLALVTPKYSGARLFVGRASELMARVIEARIEQQVMKAGVMNFERYLREKQETSSPLLRIYKQLLAAVEKKRHTMWW